MKAVVGLGNPGSRYDETRHNIGFHVVGRFAQMEQAPGFMPSRCCKGLESSLEIDGQEIRLLMPMTFMNLSGRALKPFLAHYGIGLSDLLVIYDDFHLPFGQLRVRRKGSSGGHNGLSSIIELLESRDFARMRFGIGEVKGKQSAEDFVLSEFSPEEKKELDFFVRDAADCCRAWITGGIEQVMSQFNKRKGDG